MYLGFNFCVFCKDEQRKIIRAVDFIRYLWYTVNINHDRSFLWIKLHWKEMIALTETVYTTQQIQTILKPIFMSHNVKKAVLFGSYAKGLAKKNSDVDILVDSGLKGLAFFGLLEDVVTSLEKDVDMIDVSQVIKNSDVDNEIKRSGVMIYG